jgi:uncharacterized repeat protein (TIGR03803 family)
VAPLIEAQDGRLFGTTPSTVYSIYPNGADLHVYKQISGAPNEPGNFRSPLLEHSSGMLYGTSRSGGLGQRVTVYKLDPKSGAFEVLHMFGSSPKDPALPSDGLVLSPDDRLLGTTLSGGEHNSGTLFILNRDGKGFEVLHHFSSSAEGRRPSARMLASKPGVYYGTTPEGGRHNGGTIFEVRFEANRR